MSLRIPAGAVAIYSAGWCYTHEITTSLTLLVMTLTAKIRDFFSAPNLEFNMV
jgi:hypothetical protein